MKEKFPNLLQLNIEFFSIYPAKNIFVVSTLISCGLSLLGFYDIPTRLYYSQGKFVSMIEIILILVILLYVCKSNHIINQLTHQAINAMDLVILIALVSFTGYVCVRYCFLVPTVEIPAFLLVDVLLVFTVLERACYLFELIKERHKSGFNLVTLEELYDNNLPVNMEGPIQISEKDVEVDLFGRNVTVEQIYYSIVGCTPKDGFVIGVEGEWGTGKSTALNIVKKRIRDENPNIIVIDDFDPWEYGNQEALLSSFYDILIKKAGLTILPSENEKILNSIIATCAESIAENYHVRPFVKPCLSNLSPFRSSIGKLRNRISSYLQNSSKKFVFIIDNLDRASDENIMLLFKLISVVFDFPGIVYVLSYDRERINKILENTHEFNPRFIEKIIQQEIKIPDMGVEQKKLVYDTCVRNLISAYGIDAEQFPGMDVLQAYILQRTRNIRMFIRMLNSVFPVVYTEHCGLNLFDLIGIELIHFYEPHLYHSIKNKPDYFISNGTPGSLAPLIVLEEEKINSKIQTYYNQIFRNEDTSSDLLCELFPSIDIFRRSKKVEVGKYIDDINTKKNMRICDVDSFQLYFSFSSNKFSLLKNSVMNLIEKVNKSGSKEEIDYAFMEFDVGMDYTEFSDLTGVLIIYSDQITPEKCYPLALTLYDFICREDAISKINMVTQFPNPSRLLAKLLISCTTDEITKFYGKIESHERYIDLMYLISREGIRSSKMQLAAKKPVLNLMRQIYNQSCERILETRIDIFSNQYYRVHNSRYIHMYCAQINKTDDFKKYIYEIANPYNIYRILWELVEADTDEKHLYFDYYVSDMYWDRYVIDPIYIENCLEQNKPANEDQYFLQRLFYNYLQDMNGEAEEPTKIRLSSEKYIML